MSTSKHKNRVLSRLKKIDNCRLYWSFYMIHQISNKSIPVLYTTQQLLFPQPHQTLDGMRSWLEHRKERWEEGVGREGVHRRSIASHWITAVDNISYTTSRKSVLGVGKICIPQRNWGVPQGNQELVVYYFGRILRNRRTDKKVSYTSPYQLSSSENIFSLRDVSYQTYGQMFPVF